jgi:acyl carrier protein
MGIVMGMNVGDLTLWAFRQVLDDPDITPDDDFFVVGGDSVGAIMALSAISDALGADIPVALFFIHHTAAELAEAIAATLASARD